MIVTFACHVDVQLGCGQGFWQGIEHSAGIGGLRQNFQQACACVHAIVKAKPTLFEEGVTAHFARQSGLVLFHRGFNQAVACAADDGLAAVFTYPRRQ